MAEEKTPDAPAQEQPASQPAAPAAPAKKSHTVLIVVLVLVGIFVVLPILAATVGSVIIGNQINGFFKKAEKGQVSVNVGGQNVSLNSSETQTWPSSAPSVVPKFTAGKITSSIKIGEAWTVTATNVTSSDYTKYVSDLTAAGFAMDQEADINGLKTISGAKDGYRVSVTYTPAENGSGNTIMVGVVKENQ